MSVEFDDGQASAPVWASFADLMSVLLGAFVLVLVGALAIQAQLASRLDEEVRQREQEARQRHALEQALAGPLAEGRVTLVDGRIGIGGNVLFALNSDRLQPEGEELLLSACGECHLALIGGEPLGPRRMYWNFVASDAALLEKAKQDWAAWNWPRVPGETARIELPARTP